MRYLNLTAIVALSVLLAACSTDSPTAEDLQIWLRSPFALFLIMIVSWGANGLKQTAQAKIQGTSDMSFWTYFSFARETAAAFAGNILAFVLLLATGQFDKSAPLGLMITAVIGIGYGINSVADLTSKGGRSAALAGQEPPK